MNSPHLSYCRSPPSPSVGRFCLFSVFESNWWLGKATAINVTRIRMNQDPLKIEIKYIQQEKERERIWRTCYLSSCFMRLWDQKSDKAGSINGSLTILQACHMCRPMETGIFPLQPIHPDWPNQICGQFLRHNASFVVSSAPARNGKLQVCWVTYLGNIIFLKGTCVPCIHNFQKVS